MEESSRKMGQTTATVDLPKTRTGIKKVDLAETVHGNTRSGMSEDWHREQAVSHKNQQAGAHWLHR
jgi:hypothetical protein